MRIGVTGWQGRLGTELVSHWGCVPLKCDIRYIDSIHQALESINPHVVINCAAITQVDACEDYDIDEHGVGRNAVLVNFYGVENLKNAAKCPIIHISTDYVFSGAEGPYKEEFADSEPVNLYGWTKWLGEVAYLSSPARKSVLVRSTGLYGRKDSADFVSLVISTLSENKQLKVSKELFGNPTYIPHLAEGLIYVAEHLRKFVSHPIVHIASREIVSRYEFAQMIADVFGLNKELLIPVSNADIDGWVAKRPTKGGLKTDVAQKLGVPIYSVEEGLRALKNEI